MNTTLFFWIVVPMLLLDARATAATKEIVELELLTHTEVHDKIHKEGKTSVLIVTGGTEQRGPHAVLGGHNIMSRNKGIAIARQLGNALLAPILPFSITEVSAAHPGGVTLPPEVFYQVVIAEIESMAKSGFRHIFLMGDHGGGQEQLKAAAADEERKLQPQGVHVYYVGDFYFKSRDSFAQYSYEHQIPISVHAGVSDTSELLYWEPVRGLYVRELYKSVPFDPGPTLEEWKAAREPQAASPTNGQPPSPSNVQIRRVNNGVLSDPHLASRTLGERVVEFGIHHAVTQIRQLLTAQTNATRR